MTIRKITEKQKEKNRLKTVKTKELHSFFLKVFDERKDEDGYVTCYETGSRMKESSYKYNSCIYSHCLPKEMYPEYALERWNILLVKPEVHDQWGLKPEKTPKMLAYYELVKRNIMLKEQIDKEIDNFTEKTFTGPSVLIINTNTFKELSLLLDGPKLQYRGVKVIRTQDVEDNNFLLY